jgi:DNA repair protein RecN (Recombination protein N)
VLTELHIEDLGVIHRLDLRFGPGLTVFTGETGAGKTMLVEAIELLVGGRADAGVVRSGAPEARIEGRFELGDDEVVLARVVPADGRSRAYVNGRLATVSTLAELGAQLVDIHGQHAHQSLLGPATQRAALDRFAGVDDAPLRAARARLTEIDASLAALGGDQRSRARELDLLGFQLDELDHAALDDPREDVALASLEEVLGGAQAHRDAAVTALAALSGDDQGCAIDGLRAALAAVQGRAPFDEVTERLAALVEEADDLAADLRRAADAIDDDPGRLAEVVERRQHLRTLRRKYGDTLAEVIAFRDEARRRWDELHGYEGHVARLEIERREGELAERAAAAVVARARRAAAASLAAAVEQRVRNLAMPHAVLAVTVGDDDPGDDVVFELAANPGSPPQPLTKVASGGELARTMLALRLVLTEAPATLVFDEVDAGIGGSAATAVGEALADLGRRHQVFVVTHLAQVAALADTQVRVSKAVVGRGGAATTVAEAELLAGDDRVAEVARMLSGTPESAAALEHARALLAAGRR